MAETFVAVRRGPAGFEQRVCLKRILPGCAADPVFVELFLDEARLLARLQCRNIVHVYDFGESDGTYYMSLELVDGVDLEGLLSSLRARGVRMAPNVALYVIGEVLAALSYAHTLEIDGEPQHIVHRDISPSNILISKNGEVKLTDFGIAKARGRSHRTQTGHTKGKIAYMSPEQMRADAVDGRSDLFAIGVVLFELLTGSHPFDANTDFALQLNIMNGKRPPLHDLLPDAPAPIAELVDHLLATKADDRPATAADAIALIPPIDAAFKLQRELQLLVAQRSGAAASASGSSGAVAGYASASHSAGQPAPKTPPSGAHPGAAPDPSHAPTLQAPQISLPNAQPVTARQTSTRPAQGRPSRLKPVLFAGVLAALLLGIGGYLLVRGGQHLPPVAELPTVPVAPTEGPTRSAEPEPPHRVAAQASQPAGAAGGDDELPRGVPLGAPGHELDARDEAQHTDMHQDDSRLSARQRRHERRKREDEAAGSSAQPPTGSPSVVQVEAPPPPAVSPPSPPSPPSSTQAQAQAQVVSRPVETRAFIQAPQAGNENAKQPSGSGSYVTPSGRVVIKAPPLP